MWNLLLPLAKPLIDKLVDRIPNKNERARAAEEFETELLNAVTQASFQQGEINKIEAAHPSRFVAGWRPFIGWVCGWSILWSFLVQPVLIWMGFGELPELQTDQLFQLVLAMLGMGGLRTFEKLKGVNRNN